MLRKADRTVKSIVKPKRETPKDSLDSISVFEAVFLVLGILAFVGHSRLAMKLFAPLIVVGVILWVLRVLVNDSGK